MTSAPTFLFGFERSGTTLLTMMVGAHPRLSCPLSVTGTWWHFADRLAEFGRLETPADIRRMVAEVAVHERLALWNVSFDEDRIASQISPGSYSDLVSAFHTAAAQAEGKSAWVNMDIVTLFRFEDVARLFPTARFVQIVRDGRDVALSFKGYRYGGLNALEIADQWSRATVAADRIGHALGPERYLRLRYEDIVALPEDTLDQFCDFIGERFEPAMLDYAKDVSRKVPQKTRDLWPVLDRPPQTDRVERWKREMKGSERYVIEESARDALDRFGYARGGEGFSAGGELRGAWCYLTRGERLKRLRGK